MKGRIYTDHRCPMCGSTLKSIEPQGLKCENQAHVGGEYWYTGKCRVVFDNNSSTCASYGEAYRLLIRKRGEVDAGTYDARDYKIRSKPLGFKRLAWEWLDFKASEVKPESLKPLRLGMGRAVKAWGDSNIKSIGLLEISNLLKSLEETLSPKSRKHTLDALKQFWQWAADYHDIPPMKKWPKLGYIKMEFRQTVDIETQEDIINDIKANEPLRVWLAIKWLATYIAIRPGEMCSLADSQVDRVGGRLIIPHPKERRAKIIPLIQEDIEIIRNIPRTFDPDTPFFRHETGEKWRGKPFGHDLLYRVWKRACVRLGVDGVSIYPGTKHSTACGLREVATPEEIKAMTLHSTSAAFHRYFMTGGNDHRELSSRRQKKLDSSKLSASKKAVGDNGEVFEFSKK